MGIFSFLSRNQEYENAGPAAAQSAAEEPPVSLPTITREMSIEVVEGSGRVLNTGLVTSHAGRELSMGRHPGGLSFKICEPGSTVYVRGCDNQMMQFFLRATVVESTRILMKLKDLEPEILENNRDAFRLSVSLPITVYYYNDEHYEHPEKCTLVDISTGGCCFMSEYLHGEGEVLRLKIKLDDYVPMNFVGEVIRVTERGPDEFHCGILFAQLTKEETETLTKVLFNMQTGNRREHSRSETGHW